MSRNTVPLMDECRNMREANCIVSHKEKSKNHFVAPVFFSNAVVSSSSPRSSGMTEELKIAYRHERNAAMVFCLRVMCWRD